MFLEKGSYELPKNNDNKYVFVYIINDVSEGIDINKRSVSKE